MKERVTSLPESPPVFAALCLHTVRRARGVLQKADDSNGEIGGLCQVIGAEWVLSLKAAGPQPAGFGDTHLQVQLDDPFGCFDAAAAEAAIGEPAMARYRCAIGERWRRAKDAVLTLKAEHAAKVALRKGRAPAHEKTVKPSQFDRAARLNGDARGQAAQTGRPPSRSSSTLRSS